MNTLNDLLISLAGAPSLPGAKCRGKHHLFDGGERGGDAELLHARWRQAIGLCQQCPSLDPCAAWFDSLPKTHRPHGVVAGRINLSSKPTDPPAAT